MDGSRRGFLGKCLMGGGVMLGGGVGFSAEEQKRELRQSVMGWCFNGRKVKPGELAAKCLEFGITGIEGVPAEAYPEVRKMGMEISLVSESRSAEARLRPGGAGLDPRGGEESVHLQDEPTSSSRHSVSFVV